MITFWIILGICIIPPIFNVTYAFIIVKFNLWSGLSEFILCDCSSKHKIDKTSIIFLIAPFLSCMNFIVIIFMHFFVGVYKLGKILLYPFIKAYEFMTNGLFSYFNKVEEKMEFFEKINNH